MILGVGTDLVEIDRVRKACERDSFVGRTFTELERRQAGGKISRFAGSFAVKEAVAKALGTGFRAFMPIDIEVARDELGKPYVNLYRGAKALAHELGVERIDLAWKENEPGYIPVLTEILEHIVVEKAILAEELKTVSPAMHEEILKTLPQGVPVEYVPHVELKEQTKQARGIIRTGEFTPYPSVILVAGCAY